MGVGRTDIFKNSKNSGADLPAKQIISLFFNSLCGSDSFAACLMDCFLYCPLLEHPAYFVPSSVSVMLISL